MPPPQDPQAIYRSLVVTFGQQGADQLIQQLGQVSQGLVQTGQQAQKTTGLIGNIGKGAASTVRGVAALGIGISSTAVAMRGLGIDLISSQKQLFEFNKGLLASRALFAKYGENVAQTKARIIELKDEYEFTRDELLNLQKQFQTGFTYLPVQQMTGYMRYLADAVGESSGEMAALDQVFQGISQKLPVFQQMLRGNQDMLSGAGRDILDAMFVTGQIGTAEYKQASGGIAAAEVAKGRDPAEMGMRDQLESVRRLITVGEDIQIEMAEMLQPTVSYISNLVEQNRDGVVKLGAIAGNILRVVSVLGGFGAARGAFNILQGGAGLRAGGGLARAGRGINTGRMGAAASGTISRYGGAAVRGTGGFVAGGFSSAFGASTITGAGGALTGGVAAAGVTIASAFATAVAGLYVGEKIADGFGRGMASVTGNEDWNYKGTISGIEDTRIEQTNAALNNNLGKVADLRMAGRGEEADKLEQQFRRIAELEALIAKDEKSRMSNSPLSLSGWMNASGNISGLQGRLLDSTLGTNDLEGRLNVDAIERSQMALKAEHEELDKLRLTASKTVIELKEQVAAEEAALKAEQERVAQIERIRVSMELVTFEVERQEALIEAQIGAYQTLIQLQSMGGGASINLGFGAEPEQQAAVLDDLDKGISSRQSAIAALQNLNQIINQRQDDQGRDGARPPVEQLDAIKAALEEAASSGAGISEDMLDSITAGLAEGISAREVMIQILQLQTEIGQKEVQRNDIVSSVAQKYAGLEEQARAAEGVLANQVQLANNLAMGVGASAAMIFQQVQAVERVIQALQAQRREMELSYQAEIKQLEASNKIDEAKRLEFQMTTKLLEMDGKITSERTKQAGLSKTLRDGWVSAISSMMTGEGMFTKIVVDQNTRLGTMMSASDNKTVGLRTGFAGRGFEESQRYVPGGIVGDNSGLTDNWLQSMSDSNPLASLFMQASDAMDPAEVAASVMEWMSEIGRHLSTGAAGASGSRYGTSEFLDSSENPSGSIGTTSTGVSSIIEQVTANALETHSVKIELSTTDKRQIVEELKKELYRSFRGIAESAAHKVVDDLNMRN